MTKELSETVLHYIDGAAEEKVLISSLPIGMKIAAELILDYFEE